MASRRRFFLLDEPCSASEIPKMMCRVVTDKYLPLYRFAPLEPLSPRDPSHNTNDIFPDILPPASRTTSRKEFFSTIQDRSIQATVSTIFGLDISREKEQRVSLETKEVKRYALNNPAEVFKTLMKNELYARDVRALLKDTSFGRAYLIVGFLTTSGALWTREGVQRTNAGAKGSVPVTEILGAPSLPGLNVDPGLEFKVGTAQKTKRTMTSEDEEVFAVAYAVLKVKYGFDRHGVTRTEKVGPPKRGNASHLAFSSPSSDEDEDDEEEDDEEEDDIGAKVEVEAKLDVLMDEDTFSLDSLKWSFELN